MFSVRQSKVFHSFDRRSRHRHGDHGRGGDGGTNERKRKRAKRNGEKLEIKRNEESVDPSETTYK